MRWPWTPRVLSRAELGALGERHAARFLRARGLRLLEGNYRTTFGEIDLIARDGDTLVFVEVRTRAGDSDAITPLDSVNPEKQRRLVRLARAYLRRRRLAELPCRFDVVEVLATPTGAILDLRHHVGAFGDET